MLCVSVAKKENNIKEFLSETGWLFKAKLPCFCPKRLLNIQMEYF